MNVPRDSVFVNQTDNSFNYSHNYHLRTMPTTYIGSDGTQVGIYGGTFPYKEGAVPSNPHIQYINISPQTNNNAELNVKIKVKAQTK